jgi:thymidylate kinase
MSEAFPATKIFLEGLPGAGKSTLLDHLGLRGIPVVHELGYVLDPTDFPGDGASVDEILAIDDWFIEKEKERMENASGVFDRSYFTHLTYAYGYSRFMGLPSFEPTVRKYQSVIKAGQLHLPDGIIYVDVPPELSIERQETRMRLGVLALKGFWMDQHFLADLREAYDMLFQSCKGIPTVRIDGTLTSENQADQVIRHLAGITESDSGRSNTVDLEHYIDSPTKKL